MARPKMKSSRLSLLDKTRMVVMCFSFFIITVLLIIFFNSSTLDSVLNLPIGGTNYEKRYFSAFSFPSLPANQFLPDEYSGIGLNKIYHLDTHYAYDNPFLSVSFWLRVDTFEHEKFSFVFGDRDLDCVKGRQAFGYAVYLSNREKRLYLVWKSDSSPCEKSVIVNSVPLHQWFHVGIVFSTERVSHDTDQLSYPTRIELYYNGEITSTMSTTRFISYDDQNYLIGISPNGKSSLVGRVFYLMVFGYNLSSNEMEAIYHGEKATIDGLQRNADRVFGTQYIDYDSMKREEAEKVEIYDVASMLKLLHKRYLTNTVFHPTRTPASISSSYTPQVYEPEKRPLMEYVDFRTWNYVEEDVDEEVSDFIVSLWNMNTTKFSEGTYWYKTPESIYPEYEELNKKRANHILNSFQFAWSSYKELAWGYDEMGPRTGFGNKEWGHIGMTILDSIDTLYIMGFHEDVDSIKEWMEKHYTLDHKFDYNVKELNIRVLGSFLSMYDITKDKFYLKHAKEVANLLLKAITSYYGYPRPLINGQSKKSSFYSWSQNRVTPADVGTLSLEFNYLSKVTGDKKYSKTIQQIYKSLYKVPTFDGLLPTYIRIDTNEGSGLYDVSPLTNSYYEYLLKTWIQGGKKDKSLQRRYNAAVDGIYDHLIRRNPQGLLYLTEVENENDAGKPRMGLEECFIGSMLSLGILHDVNPSTRERDLNTARALTYTCMRLYFDAPLGLASEKTDLWGEKLQVVNSAVNNDLRPEAIESLYYLNQITGDPIYREWGWKIWKAIEHETKSNYGFGNSLDVRTRGKIDDRVDSFFFSKTLKFFYLLFKDEQVYNLMNQVINKEGHAFSINSFVCYEQVMNN